MSTIITITINNIMDDSHPLCIITLLLITNIINIIIIQNCYSSCLFLIYIYVISIFSPLHQQRCGRPSPGKCLRDLLQDLVTEPAGGLGCWLRDFTGLMGIKGIGKLWKALKVMGIYRGIYRYTGIGIMGLIAMIFGCV